MKIVNFLKPSELANLFRISRQTILFYDRKQVLLPALIDETGNRYYSSNSFFMLHIIWALKKIGVSLAEIRNFIEVRNEIKFELLLQTRRKEYVQEIEKLERLVNGIDKEMKLLNKYKNIKCNVIIDNYEEEEYFLLGSKFIPGNSIKDNIIKMGEFYQTLLPFQWEIAIRFGLLIDVNPSDISAKNFNFLVLLSEPLEKKKFHTKKAGRYITIYIQSTLFVAYINAYNDLKAYADKNNFKLVGNAYVVVVNDYWTNKEPKNFICRVTQEIARLES